MINLLEQFINDVWESEAPQVWRDVKLVSLQKKGVKIRLQEF